MIATTAAAETRLSVGEPGPSGLVPAWPLLDRALPLTVLVGSGTGLLYGIVLRGWMRLIAPDPEFTWSGTGAILIVFTILGTMAGLTAAGRVREWGGGLLVIRSVGIVLSLTCFFAAGIVMFPMIIPAALGVGRTDWPRRLRGACVAVGVLVAVAFVVSGVLLDGDLSMARRVLAALLFLPLCAVEVRLVAELYAPSARTRRPGSIWRWAALGLAAVGGLLVLAIAGTGA